MRIYAGWIVSFLLAFLLTLTILSRPVFASIFYLTPSESNLEQQGSILPVKIMLDTQNEDLNAASAYILYPSDKLEITYVNLGDKFTFPIEDSNENGLLKISLGSFADVKGDILFATLGLKGVTSGTANLAFTTGSLAARSADASDSLNLAGSEGATINITKSGSQTTVQPEATSGTTNTANSASASQNCNLPQSEAQTKLNRLVEILNTFELRIYTITNLVKDYYNKLAAEGSNLRSYKSLSLDIETKKAVADLNINDLNNLVKNFDCQGDKSKQLKLIKDKTKLTKSALKNYQVSVRNLLLTVKNLNP